MTALVTLTTDFGTRDSYVAQLKGVLLRLGPPGLQILDLSHDIGAHAVREGAFFLRGALPQFPPGTIHVAVIDPGVGSARRPIAIATSGQLLVGPDNGLFGWLLGPDARAHEIARDRGEDAVSATFHGRDVFAPAAARLARGTPLHELGAGVRDPVRLAWPEPVVSGAGVRGEVVHVDRFGNLITNVTRELLPRAPLQVRLGRRKLGGLRDHYAQVRVGTLLALVGSSGLLEVAVREGSAHDRTGAGVGARVDVETVPVG